MTIVQDGNLVAQGPTGAAITFVSQGWDYFEQKITDITELAIGMIDSAANLPSVEPVSFSVEFPSLTGLTEFQKPLKPVLPEITYNAVSVPDAPDLQRPAAPASTNAPEFDVAPAKLIALPTQPGALNATEPGDSPEVEAIVLPDAPVIEWPELPEIIKVAIREEPELEDVTFVDRDIGSAPVLADLAGVGFTEQPYEHKLLDDMLPVIREGIQTGQLLPKAIEQAIFQRGRERLSGANAAALQAIDEEFTGRGFKQPPGAWGARRAEQRRTNQSEVGNLNRELTIEQHQQAIKNVQFAIERGIALEQLLIGQHAQIMDRALQSARLQLDTRVALFNAEVSTYNASIERIKADADVFRSRIEARAAEVELFRAHIEGQKATVEVNKANADLYESQIRAIAEMMNQYKIGVEAAEAQARIQQLRIEAHRSDIEGYRARVQAYAERWNGFRAAVEAQQGHFRNYEIGVNAYGARVQAWAEGERAKTGRFEADIRASGLTLEQYRSRVQQVVAQLQAEQTRIGALRDQSQSLSSMYQAEGAVAAAQNDANTRAFEAQIAYHTNRTNVKLEEARIKVQDNARIMATMSEAIRGAAQALASLAASAMSAVNFSAGVSGSGSESTGWGYNLSKSLGWSWAGETEDNNNPPIY